ncbi:MAG: hypothetical protein ACJ8IK_06655 [Burkholderiaceae bacterium]|jgi:hypothetical protein
MTKTVRIAVPGSDVYANWPPRCPRCGARDVALASSTVRVGRATFDRSSMGGGFRDRVAMMSVSVPMCQSHADANDVANLILERSPMMSALRGFVWFGLAKLGLVMLTAARHGGFDRHRGLVAALCFFVGFGGLVAIRWANTNAAVQPLGFDSDMRVLKLQFADEEYAADFKAANPVDTDARHTAPPPWYQRSIVWEIGLPLLMLIWLALRGY